MAADDLASQLKAANLLATDQPAESVSQLRAVLDGGSDAESSDPEVIKIKEQAVQHLCDAYVKAKDAPGLVALLTQLRGFFAVIPKAKTARLIRSVIDSIAKVPDSTDLQVQVCQEQVEWARTEKRTFLRQRIELRLATLYLDTRQYTTSLSLIGTLLSEVKKLDDKLLLVDIHLLESRVHHALKNLAKARASLTAGRTAASSIYVPVLLQAEIDLQSGVLHADERDYKTAYSYFFEAFEQFSGLNDDEKALRSLKYMLLAKIMLNLADDVPSIISSKAGLKYIGDDIEAMRSVAKAYQDRSLQTFQEVVTAHPRELGADNIISTHLALLYDTLLEQNLVRLIEPYSRVQVAHVASLIHLPPPDVELKLSQMILDKKFAGTLDQGAGCLEVFDEPPADGVFVSSIEIVEAMGRVVDTLFSRSQKIALV